MRLEVQCYAGYRGEETPRRFTLDGREIEVSEVVDRWLAPDYRYFKLRTEDGVYILRHDTPADRWELAMFRSLTLEPGSHSPAERRRRAETAWGTCSAGERGLDRQARPK